MSILAAVFLALAIGSIFWAACWIDGEKSRRSDEWALRSIRPVSRRRPKR